jgi:hypothetical protein
MTATLVPQTGASFGWDSFLLAEAEKTGITWDNINL